MKGLGGLVVVVVALSFLVVVVAGVMGGDENNPWDGVCLCFVVLLFGFFGSHFFFFFCFLFLFVFVYFCLSLFVCFFSSVIYCRPG